MKGNKLKYIIIFVIGIFIYSLTFYIYQIFNTPNFQVDSENRSFYIYEGATFDDVRDALYEGKYVNDVLSFALLSKLMNYDDLVKPGHYIIESNATNVEVIRMLRAGEQTPVNITFNNVRLLGELPKKVCRTIQLDTTTLDSALFAPQTPAKYGFTKASFPAMFIPNTYEVYWTISAEGFLDKMKAAYDRFWSEERLSKANDIDLTPVEVSILASIVQAEAKHNDEAPVIAGLYMNRLQKGMLLQADPTLVFALGDFSIQRVLNKHKAIDSPYNTYKYPGLPPGPINLPSLTMLKAVLNYEDHDYLYMCAKPDFSGYHNFTSSLSQHLRNARAFQRALNNARIYE